MSVTKYIEKDAAGRQVHRIRIVGTSVGAATVFEVPRAPEPNGVPAACVLVRVHEFAATGASMTNRQPDVWQGTAGQSMVGAAWPRHYQASSTAKAVQVNDSRLGLVLAIPDGESLYYRQVPDGGADNTFTADLYFLDVSEGQ